MADVSIKNSDKLHFGFVVRKKKPNKMLVMAVVGDIRRISLVWHIVMQTVTFTQTNFSKCYT